MQSFSTVCVDANVVVDGVQLAGRENSLLSDLWGSFYTNRTTFLQPKLFDAEITSVFRKLVFDKDMTSLEARQMLKMVFQLPIDYCDDQTIHFEALEIADALGVRAAYDAHYIAVARRGSIPLVTSDRRLANAALRFVEVLHIPQESV